MSISVDGEHEALQTRTIAPIVLQHTSAAFPTWTGPSGKISSGVGNAITPGPSLMGTMIFDLELSRASVSWKSTMQPALKMSKYGWWLQSNGIQHVFMDKMIH